ncbi:hypothetical protein GBAR_LOCUS11440 [Geodia barretti]|uniref:Uncharacterized protein n=1 Tax=Geodia barretti TaxID=519541 RepID=A0AA35WFW1_GEOBA|nr:hypothetical protein GBAR_LOCUS11440 [Geodia barretti]
MYQHYRYYTHKATTGKVITTIITGLHNSRHTVSVTAINSCGLSSEPAPTTVEPRDKPPSPACYCKRSKSEGGSWKVDVKVVYPRDAHVKEKPKLEEGSCSETCPVFDDTIPQREEYADSVASCCFTVLVEDDLQTGDNGGEGDTLSKGGVADIAISSSTLVLLMGIVIVAVCLCLRQRSCGKKWLGKQLEKCKRKPARPCP